MKTIPNAWVTAPDLDPGEPRHGSLKRLLAVGTLNANKNQREIIEALALLSTDVRLTVVGDGPESQSLKKRAQALGVSERVDFLGEVSNATVSQLMRSHDVLVHASRGETFGYVYLEAAEANLPVISREHGVARWMLNRYVPGTIYGKDARSLANAIERFQDVTDTERQAAVDRRRQELDPGLIFGTWRRHLDLNSSDGIARRSIDPLPVTVILPVHEVGPAAFDAVVAKVRDLAAAASQVIVVDDGSKDGTAQALARGLDGLERVQLVILPQNRGVAHARNEALALARERYVWFVDWDDRWAGDILPRLVARAEETDADVVVCRAVRIDDQTGRRVNIDGVARDVTMDGHEALTLVLRGRLQGYLWSKLLRRDILPVPMFPIQRSQSDFGGLVPVLAAARRVTTISEVLYEHLVREGSITNSRDPDINLFSKSHDVVHTVARQFPGAVNPVDLLRYDYEHLHIARAVTAARLFSNRAASADVARESAEQMKWQQLFRVARSDPRTAGRGSLIKLASSRYPTLYQASRQLRAAASNARGSS